MKTKPSLDVLVQSAKFGCTRKAKKPFICLLWTLKNVAALPASVLLKRWRQPENVKEDPATAVCFPQPLQVAQETPGLPVSQGWYQDAARSRSNAIAGIPQPLPHLGVPESNFMLLGRNQSMATYESVLKGPPLRLETSSD